MQRDPDVLQFLPAECSAPFGTAPRGYREVIQHIFEFRMRLTALRNFTSCSRSARSSALPSKLSSRVQMCDPATKVRLATL